MSETLTSFLYQLFYLFTHLSFADVLDIILVAVTFFLVFQAIHQTRASQMLSGILIVAILGLALLNLLPLNTFNWLLRSVLLAGVVALPMIFQNELRQALVELGQIGQRLKGTTSTADHLKTELISAATQLAVRREGALIVLEGKTPLAEIVKTGISLQAENVTTELLLSIFNPKTPLHDGAVIIRRQRLVAASCILPVQTGKTGKQHLGTRHRAALGLSTDVPDALVIVVSEERGVISIAHAGRLYQDLSRDDISNRLDGFQGQLTSQDRNRWVWVRSINSISSLRNFITAISLAVVAWVSVIYQTDPPQAVTLTDIPLNILAPASDFILRSELPDTINVQIQTTRDRLTMLNSESVRADLNLTELTNGVHQVPVEVTLADPRAQLISLSPKFLDVSLEPLATFTFTPTVTVPDVDSLPPGYALRELRLSPDTITVEGPLSLVARVDKALAELSLNGRRTSFQQSVSLALLTESGQLVEGLRPIPETILVEAPIDQTFNTREIAVHAMVDTSDLGPALTVSRVALSPATVTLTGDRQTLENAGSYLETAPIRLANVNGELTVEVPLILPEGTLAINGEGTSVNSVVVQVTVEAVISYQIITQRPTWRNLSPTLSVEQLEPDEITVLLTGPQPLIEKIQAEPGLVVVFLNLADFDAGIHTIRLDVQAPTSLQVELFPPQVQVVLEMAAE